MGYMVKGIYHVGDDVTRILPSGEWERAKSTVRNWITPDGSAGPTGDAGFPAADDRYHLFAAWNCPWAHRALLVRKLKGLEDVIPVSYARPNRTDQGWVFDGKGEFSDPALKALAVHEVYSADPGLYTGRNTVPVLWDRVQSRMVSNESADIVRMLNSAYEPRDARFTNLCPEDLVDQINHWNELIYQMVNNGVYRAGFASTQQAYEIAAHQVFRTLDKIDAHLAKNHFLCGDVFTEADLRLFPTLARFDVAYHTAFRCNLRRVVDYPNLWPYARQIYQMKGVSDTVRFDIYKRGYFSKSENRNPFGIVPLGPDVDWTASHGRAAMPD